MKTLLALLLFVSGLAAQTAGTTTIINGSAYTYAPEVGGTSHWERGPNIHINDQTIAQYVWTGMEFPASATEDLPCPGCRGASRSRHTDPISGFPPRWWPYDSNIKTTGEHVYIGNAGGALVKVKLVTDLNGECWDCPLCGQCEQLYRCFEKLEVTATSSGTLTWRTSRKSNNGEYSAPVDYTPDDTPLVVEASGVCGSKETLRLELLVGTTVVGIFEIEAKCTDCGTLWEY